MGNITIIDNYRDLSLGDYQDILAISRDDTLEELDKQVKIMSILTGMAENELLDLPIMEYKTLAGKMTFLERELDNVQRISKSYNVGEYDLIPVMDMRKVTTAQYIDFQSFHQAGMEEHFAEILSCLLVPKGKRYNQDYDILDLQNAIRKEMNVYDAISLYGFFLISCRDSMKDMLTFSLQEAQKIQDKQKRTEIMNQIQGQISLLMTNGDGSPM